MGKFYLREVTRSFAKTKALASSSAKSLLLCRLRALQRQFDAGDSTEFGELYAVQEELREHELQAAEAAQVRSRCIWAEEGEVSSGYFFSLEQKHRSKYTMSTIKDPETGTVHHDLIAILGVWRTYYKQLFTAQSCDPATQDHLLSKLVRTLAPGERELCEGLLSSEECEAAFKGMSSGKTPRSDGFPIEFYLCFWAVLGPDLVRILNLAYEVWQLSISQRRGLIIVLFKKGDRLVTKNWHPISLSNVDYKIATRALAGRLLKVISTVVSPDQTREVPGRSIGENLSVIRDLINYAAMEDIPVALLSLDQEKAFDRVDWGFLSRVLETMGFGPSFRRWVSLFYTNVESAVVINCWTSPSFSPSCGVRQGCPLSPLLYVLCAEVLACNLRAAPGIHGVHLPKSLEELRVSGYADDTMVVVTTDD